MDIDLDCKRSSVQPFAGCFKQQLWKPFNWDQQVKLNQLHSNWLVVASTIDPKLLLLEYKRYQLRNCLQSGYCNTVVIVECITAAVDLGITTGIAAMKLTDKWVYLLSCSFLSP